MLYSFDVAVLMLHYVINYFGIELFDVELFNATLFDAALILHYSDIALFDAALS